MSASKNDKTDAKPAMQFVNSQIWNTIRNINYDPVPNFPDALLSIINDVKVGLVDYGDVLRFIARNEGRIELLRSVGLAMRAGEIKYGDWNFLGGHGRLQLLAAMERHAMCIYDGEFNDPDTSKRLGVPVSHLGCIVAGINMTWYQEEYGTLKEDGPKRPGTSPGLDSVYFADEPNIVVGGKL